jgi:hypothetical protein
MYMRVITIVHGFDSWSPKPSQPVPDHTAQHQTTQRWPLYGHFQSQLQPHDCGKGAVGAWGSPMQHPAHRPAQRSVQLAWHLWHPHSRTHWGPAGACQTQHPHLQLPLTPPPQTQQLLQCCQARHCYSAARRSSCYSAARRATAARCTWRLSTAWPLSGTWPLRSAWPLRSTWSRSLRTPSRACCRACWG